MVLNEHEKKERFRKHLEKKDKSKPTENEVPFFNPYDRNVEFFHQQVIFNTPFKNPVFRNFDEPDTFNFNFNLERSRPASNVCVQKTAVRASEEIIEPFVFFNENTGIQKDEYLPTENFKNSEINPENIFPFPIQRSHFETNLNYAENINTKILSTTVFITNSESNKNELKQRANMTNVHHLNMNPEFFINYIFQLHKMNEIILETQQLLDSDMYLHKKFSKCTERNPIVKPSRN